MKSILAFAAALFVTVPCFSQSVNDFLIGVNLDLIKSNQHGYFERTQAGVEVNYFLFSGKFAATGGAEYWTANKQLSSVVGARWYPVPEAFVRLRALIGANEVSLGGGWAKPLNENWRFEAMGDFYTDGHIAIRAGVAYHFQKQ